MKPPGTYSARIADSVQDVLNAQALRATQFGDDEREEVLDVDVFDDLCTHVLIETCETGEIHACFRFMYFAPNQTLTDSYSAQFYDLKRLGKFGRPMLEIGRFCVKDGVHDHAALRVAWAFLTRYVDANDIALMFGCSSFEGIDETRYKDAFGLLAKHHQAPDNWKPRVKAPEVYDYADCLKDCEPSLKNANRNMPPLLRTYLGMGAWVSDHAVVDRAMGTLHVFTGVEVNAIPASRARLLRMEAGALQA